MSDDRHFNARQVMEIEHKRAVGKTIRRIWIVTLVCILLMGLVGDIDWFFWTLTGLLLISACSFTYMTVRDHKDDAATRDRHLRGL